MKNRYNVEVLGVLRNFSAVGSRDHQLGLHLWSAQKETYRRKVYGATLVVVLEVYASSIKSWSFI